jgi:hypothetical protein
VLFGQELQEIEGFWRERHRVAAVRQQTAIGIERPSINAESQN